MNRYNFKAAIGFRKLKGVQCNANDFYVPEVSVSGDSFTAQYKGQWFDFYMTPLKCGEPEQVRMILEA